MEIRVNVNGRLREGATETDRAASISSGCVLVRVSLTEFHLVHFGLSVPFDVQTPSPCNIVWILNVQVAQAHGFDRDITICLLVC